MSPEPVRRDFRSSSSIRADIQEFYNKPIARVSFELIVSVFVVIVFAIFALRPTLITMSQLLRDIEEKRTLDKQLGDKVSALATAQSEYAVYQPQIAALDSAILRNASLEEVAYYLEWMLAESGLHIQRISFADIPVLTSPEEDTSDLALQQYQIQLSVEGELPQLRAFLKRIESVKPLFSTTGWTVSPTDGKDKPPMSASINLGVYVYEASAVPSRSSTSTATGSRP